MASTKKTTVKKSSNKQEIINGASLLVLVCAFIIGILIGYLIGLC